MIRDIPKETRARFTWESDGRVDSFHVLPLTGPIRGDCDDYAATVLYGAADGSWMKFWWLLVSGQACFWLVRAPSGEKHVTIWLRGYGYTDNWKREWTPTETLHKRLLPFPWPLVALKMFIGLFDPT